MLDEVEGKDVKVYAIWYNMLASDSEEKWPAKLLTDPRVVHFWDAEKIVGTWYGENVTVKRTGHVEWDAYFLYAASSEWKEEGPSDRISWGRTIVDSRKRLQEDLLEALSSKD